MNRAYYIPDVPCKHEHNLRYVATNNCVECHRASVKKHESQTNARKRSRRWARNKLPIPTRPEPSRCECCGNPSTKGHSLCLDHDHETGQFRGWLCQRCNRSIGQLGDTKAGVMQALNYLERANEINSL